jgi:lipoyl synthase
MKTLRIPPWIRNRLAPATHAGRLRNLTYSRGLATVCHEARCPNQAGCSSRGSATFLILGHRCTRSCSFCAVDHGVPLPVDPAEAVEVAATVQELGLRHVVITSVTRDDLPDGGADHFAATLVAIRTRCPETTLEVLVPDFRGSLDAVRTVLAARPDVFAHNLETVARLYEVLRKGASYTRSLGVLRTAACSAPDVVTKTGIMVGVGESREELEQVFRDIAESGCAALTIGQYLRPSRGHHPVARYVPPEEFEEFGRLAAAAGIRHVVSGPLVRSSYQAGELLHACRSGVGGTVLV